MIKSPPRIHIWLLVIAAAIHLGFAAEADGAKSEWVHPGTDGKLVYRSTAAGDRIMDFSHAGYRGGGVALPDVPGICTVQPSGADDAALIQAAIDKLAGTPLKGTFRGAVVLGPGTFTCSVPITISTSGIVLRGSGSGGDGAVTTLRLTGKPHTGIVVRAEGSGRKRNAGDAEKPGVQTAVTDDYVPSGASAFSIADPQGFSAGDIISIRRPVTQVWVDFMQMQDLKRDGKAQTWLRPGSFTVTERKIAAISGNRISLDVPLSDSFDGKYLNPPGVTVSKIKPPERLSEVGIEFLNIESPPQNINHTQAHFTALRINAQDGWVRDVVIDETMNSVAVNGQRLTLQRVVVNRKVPHLGSSKPAEFAPNAGQVLLDRCSCAGDNIWYAATGAGQAGPIVLLNCTFRGNGRVEGHQRWTTGVLYDNCRVPEGGIDFRNRGSMGSGHGWSIGWGVAWNCTARDFIIQNPPGAANWMIGCLGPNKPMPRPFDSRPNLPQGIADSPGKPVSPQSLYLAQLAERLGPQALKNIGY